MATPLLSLCWKEHSCQLAAVCKNLLAEDFLVDCTIAAEGQKLKAHRLILSTCSPFFRMLFSDETEKHPIVILKDALFDTLKAVIDFVYIGEIQIPADQLEPFLALADSLQIKGLNNLRPKERNQILCPYIAGNVPHCLPKDNRSTRAAQDSSAVDEESAEISSQQQHPHLYSSGGHKDAVQTGSFALCKGYIESCREVLSASMVMPFCEWPINPECIDQSLDAEMTVKHEPLHSLLLETNTDGLDNIQSSERVTGNFGSELDEGSTPVLGDQDLNQFSSGRESAHGNAEPAAMMPLPKLQIEHFPDEGSSGPSLVKQHEPIHPVILVLKNERVDDVESKEFIHVNDASENCTNEGAHLAFFEPNLNQYSISFKGGSELSHGNVEVAALMPPQQQQVMQLPLEGTSGLHLVKEHEPMHPVLLVPKSERMDDAESEESLHVHDMPDMPENYTSEGTHLLFSKQNHNPSSRAAEALAARPVTRPRRKGGPSKSQTFPDDEPHRCIARPGTSGSSLVQRKKTYAGQGPFSCDSFRGRSSLCSHKRPFRCDVCGTSFSRSFSLKIHQRTHTGERPFCCDVCGSSFSLSSHLKIHQRTHTGERPFRCDVCGKSFSDFSNLKTHMRRHTGEKPYHCKVCGMSFARSGTLLRHKRRHSKSDNSLVTSALPS